MTQPVSPRALGFAPVGEWERNLACITAWPAHEYAWGAFLREAQREFVGFCSALLSDPENEALHLLVSDAKVEAEARRALAGLPAERVRYIELPYGDVWLRDTTPIFVRSASELACVRFRCNGWGGKYPYPGDAELGGRLAGALGVRAFEFDAVLEGGAIELDGQGTCLTTESCLLNPNRGAIGRARVEQLLSEAFAVDKVLWLNEGLIGDHTDGHIDNLVRFIAPGVVMHMRPTPGDPNRDTLRAIEQALLQMTDAQGRKLTLVAVPSPGAVLDEAGEPIAASYMNFYLANRTVIVPCFHSVADEAAAKAIGAAFPGRRVELRSARAILEGGGGTFHCMTRQRPEEAGR